MGRHVLFLALKRKLQGLVTVGHALTVQAMTLDVLLRKLHHYPGLRLGLSVLVKPGRYLPEETRQTQAVRLLRARKGRNVRRSRRKRGRFFDTVNTLGRGGSAQRQLLERCRAGRVRLSRVGAQARLRSHEVDGLSVALAAIVFEVGEHFEVFEDVVWLGTSGSGGAR